MKNKKQPIKIKEGDSCYMKYLLFRPEYILKTEDELDNGRELAALIRAFKPVRIERIS